MPPEAEEAAPEVGGRATYAQLELEEPTAPEVPAVKLEEVLDSEFLSQLLPHQFCTMQKCAV